MSDVKVPTFDTYMNPLIQALKVLGGSGTIKEIAAKTADIVGLTDEQLEILHNPEKGSQIEFEYRLAWTRTYLKKYDVLENSTKGVWALTQKGRKLEKVNPTTVKRYVQNQHKKAKTVLITDEVEETEKQTWREQLSDTLFKMDPSAFERLVQRLLRESGFTQVEVTGKSGDGGIDGKGEGAMIFTGHHFTKVIATT